MASRSVGPALLIAAFSLATADNSEADEAPAVVVSIKPVHSLVAGVMAGQGEPVLLVQGAGSEHSYSLRPSQARALDQADVVFWMGETMETFLIKPLQALSGNAKVVALWETPGLTLLPTREGGMWEEHDHGDEHADDDGDHGDAEHAEAHEEDAEHAHADPDEGEHAEAHEEERGHAEADHEREHAHGETDMHVWLDPSNAKVLVAAIATTLSDTDPRNASTYQTNAARLDQRLEELDRSLQDRLAAVADRPYVVFHDAYQYFEHRYGVRAVGAITINPTLRPGAQRLGEIRERLEHLDAACVFAEPQFEPALVDTLIEGTSAGEGVLDPLGAALEDGPDQYFGLMHGLADSLVECLGTAQSG
jgi:zinc transport system substrate-binding protein